MDPIVLAVSVTSSPTMPSPRVAARTSTPPSYSNEIASPSYFISQDRSTGRPAAASTSSYQSISPPSSKTLLSDSMGAMCSTLCLPPFESGAAPTVLVGESCAATSGCDPSIPRNSAIRESNSASEIIGASSTWYSLLWRAISSRRRSARTAGLAVTAVCS